MLKAVKDWGALVAVVLAAVGALLWIGELRADVRNLKDRVDGLEKRVDPLREVKVSKGDLCVKLIEQFAAVRDQRRQDVLMRQWEASGCNSMVAAAAELENATDGITNAMQLDRPEAIAPVDGNRP